MLGAGALGAQEEVNALAPVLVLQGGTLIDMHLHPYQRLRTTVLGYRRATVQS